MKHITNDNHSYVRRYAVLDLELLNDHERYAAYRSIDPRPAELRWPFRRACAAALLTFTVDEEGQFEFGHLDSWVGDDEPALLRALFNRLHLLPGYELVTWGGLSTDLLVLRMGAAEYGLRLPKQLVHGAREYGRWVHRDLANEYKAGGGAHIHMSEIATRLRLPVKFAERASMVPMLLRSGKLRRVAAIAEADVITTAMLLASQLEIHGELSGAKAAQIRILQSVRELRPEARYRDYLERVEKRIMAEAMAAAEAFATAA